MATPKHRDYLGQAHEDIQQVKASTSVDGIKLNISKELVDTLKTVNDEGALVGQARLNAVAAKNLLREEQKNFENEGAHDKASVIATAANQLSDVLSDKKSGQTNDWLSDLYTRIGRFQTQDILRIDNKEVADKSRPKLYAMGIRSQAQLDKILVDDESKELASRIFNTMKIPGGGDLTSILGDGNGSTKTATKKQPSASVNSDINSKKEDILDDLDKHFLEIESDIKKTCEGVCDITKVDKDSKYYEEMLRGAYSEFVKGSKDLENPEDALTHFAAFRKSSPYQEVFIDQFKRDTNRMGQHLNESNVEGVKPVNEYSIKQESDSIVMRFNPDNMIEQVGQHRIKDKKASFLGADFGVTVKRGGIEEKITPQITNGGKNYTVRIPKSELTGAESFKVNTPQLQPQISYQGDSKVRMEAQTTWGSREVSINEKELNDLLGAAPISSASTPISSVDPVVEELPAPELEPAAPFKGDQFSIKGRIPGYDKTKKMDVEITLNKNGKRSMLKLPDPIVADDGTFVVDIDIFKYGINEGSFDVIAMTKVAGKESDDLVRTYEYAPTITPLKMTGIGINGREITLQGETTHPSSEPSEIGYIKEGTTTYHRITALTKIGIGGGKWKYVFSLPTEGTYTVFAQVNSIGKTGINWQDNLYRATIVECKESPARPLIESPLDNTEIVGNDLPLAGVAKDSDGPIEIKISQNNGVTRPYKNINVSSDKWSRVITDLKGQGFKGGPIQVSIKSQAKSNASAWSSPITYRIPVEVVTKVDSFNIKEKQSVEIDADVESDWFVVKGTPGQTVHAFTVNGHFWNGTSYVDEGDITLSATGIYRTRVQVRSALTEKSATTMSLYVGDKSSEFKVTTKDAPVAATPENIDPITFAPQNNVELSTNTISNPEVISGITTPKAISVVAGQYRINGGARVATPGTVSAGDIVEVAVESSATHSDSKTAALNVGGKVSKFEVKTKADTTVPAPDTLNPFAFTVRNNIAPSTPVVSNQIIIAGISTPKEVRIAGGQFRVNGGAWETAMRTVSAGDLVEVQVTSSPNYNDQSVATINIGGEVQRFEVNTMASAPTATTEAPVDFPFTAVTGAALSSPITSNEIVVRGITAPASIAIANGEYSINGGGRTNTAGMVNNNDRVTVRLTSSAINSTSVDAKLFIGPKDSTFSVTTVAAAAAVAPETPNDFNFTDVSSVALGQTIDSNAVPITGITGPVPITIGGGEYSINGGRWTNTPGTVDNNDVVEVRVLSANTFNTPRTATVNIGGRVKEFKVTTAPNYAATVETPFAYPFTARNDVPLDTNIDSNEIVVAGLAAAAAIAVANGEYRVNGGAWTNAPGTVNNGDRVTMRTRSPNLHGTKVTSQLNIGGGSSSFEVTTLVAHTAPRINNPHQTVGPNTQTFTISGDVQDPNVRAVAIYNGAVALQTVPLRSIRRNLLSRNATANAFSATFNRSVLNEGQLNNIRVVSIGANGAPIANAEAHATVMCEVPAGHVTITSPSQGATIEGGKVPFAGTKSATGVRVQVSRNTLGVKSGIQECAVDGNKWTRNIEGLSHGSHTFYFRELTADGTPGRRSKVSFKVNLPLEQRTFGGVRSRFKNLFGKKDKAGAGAGEGASATSADGTAAAAGSAEGRKGGGSMFAGLWANLKDDLLWVKKVAHDQPLDAMNKGTKVVTDTIKEPITLIPGYKKK